MTDDAAVSADLPAVKGALDGVALHLAVGQVGAEVGTIGIDHLRVPRGVSKHDPSIAGALHEHRAVAEVARRTDDVPSLGIRWRITGLASGLDDRIEISPADSSRSRPKRRLDAPGHHCAGRRARKK
jgi:hypothetical protein